MITMKRFLIIFLVSVCGSLALLAQSTSSIRTTVGSKGSLHPIGATTISTGSASRAPLLRAGTSYAPAISNTMDAKATATYGLKMSLSTSSTLRSSNSSSSSGGSLGLGKSIGVSAGTSGSSSTTGGSIGLRRGLLLPLADEGGTTTGVGSGGGFTGRPGGNAGGVVPSPIGDAVLPLLLMAAAYACFLLRRRTVKA